VDKKMKLNLIQKAFIGHGRKLFCATKIKAKFECTLEQLVDAANLMAKQLPILLAYESDGKVIFKDAIVGYHGHIKDHYEQAGALCITQEDDCFWLGFTHEFLDGWSYGLTVREIFRIARGGPVGEYVSQSPIGKIVAQGDADLNVTMFSGDAGEADCRTINISNAYLLRAKEKGMRVSDYVGEIVCQVFGNINVLSSKLIKGHERDIGHYSLYGYYNLIDNNYKLTVSHENLTRNMMIHGLSEKISSCFVTSMPFGDTDGIIVDFYQRLGQNHIGRVQSVSFDGTHILQVALNTSLENRDDLFNELARRFS
jgi:hypothetical protein